jgi:predicted MFS family arabinose efflux permease
VIGSVSSAAGAWAAGAAVDLTGGYRATLVAVVTLQGLALLALWWQRAASRRADSAGGSPGL